MFSLCRQEKQTQRREDLYIWPKCCPTLRQIAGPLWQPVRKRSSGATETATATSPTLSIRLCIILHNSAYLCVCTAGSDQIQKGEVLPRSTVDKDSRRQLFSILVRQSLDNKGIPAEHGDVVHRAEGWSHFFAELKNLQLKVQQKNNNRKSETLVSLTMCVLPLNMR